MYKKVMSGKNDKMCKSGKQYLCYFKNFSQNFWI